MERDELEQIYLKYHKQLWLYALSLSGSVSDADDLVQSVFLKAFLSWKPGGSIRCWLVRVLQNEYYNLYKKRKKQQGDEGSEPSGTEEDVLEKIIKNEEKRMLLMQIMKLDAAQKEVMMSSIYFGLKDEQIAESMRITRENVRKIRSRAKQKIKRGMEEAGYGKEF